MTRPVQQALLWAAGLAWVVGIGTGVTLLANENLTPGEAAQAPRHWPSQSMLPWTPSQPVLVMLAHPQCPCTRASIRELARLQASLPTPVAVHVLFLRPADVDAAWARSDLWRAVEAIPGATAWEDREGTQAALLGARTSGQVLLYDGDGDLRFSGGITGSRGHEGDNAGKTRLHALLTSGTSDRAQAAVYGCALQEGDARGGPTQDEGGT